jgi:hypothetical protein
MMKGLAGVVLWLLVLAANAEALRCGSDLVTVGDSKFKVLFACGEPILAEVVGTEKTAGRKEILEEWTYYRGPGSFLQILTFRGGRLIRIETAERYGELN